MVRWSSVGSLVVLAALGCGPKVETDEDGVASGSSGDDSGDVEPGDPTDPDRTTGGPEPGTTGRPDPSPAAGSDTADTMTTVTGDPTDATVTTTSTTSSGTDGFVPTFADVQELFFQRCSLPGCHVENSVSPVHTDYFAIVGVPSTQSELNYIEPFEVAESYLWHKVAGTHADVGGGWVSDALGPAPQR